MSNIPLGLTATPPPSVPITLTLRPEKKGYPTLTDHRTPIPDAQGKATDYVLTVISPGSVPGSNPGGEERQGDPEVAVAPRSR